MAIFSPDGTTNNLRLSVLANVIKDKYNSDIPKLIPMQVFLWDYFKPKLEKFEGEGKFVIPMQTQLNESATATAEMVALPEGRVPSFVQGYLYLKKLLARMVISKESIVLTQGANALVKGLPNLMDSTIKPWMLSLEAFMHLNGGSYIATSAGSSSAGATTATMTVDSTRFIRPGMYLEGYDSSNTHDATAVLVVSVLSDTTFSGTGTFTSVDTATKWYQQGSWVTSGSQTNAAIYAPQGLELIVDESDPTWGSGVNFQNLDRDTYAYAKAIIRDMSDAGGSAGTNGPLSIMRIVHLLDSVWKASSHAVPHFGYCSLGVYNALAQVLRNNNQPTEVMPAKDGLPAGLEFQYHGKSIPIVSSPNCKASTMFFINKDYLFRYQSGEPKWDDEGGFLRPLEDYHAFQALYSGYINFGTTMPESQGRLNDITEITY